MTWLSQIFGAFRVFQLWVVIAPWEAGLRVRMGRTANVLDPGIHIRIPFLDRIFVQSVRLRTISDSGQTIATKDGKTLTLAVAVTYSITDIKKLYLTVSNPESTLLCQIQARIAEVVSTKTSVELTPKLIEETLSSMLPSDEWGLSKVTINITTFAYMKAFRLLNYEYRTLSSANELEQKLV